MIDVSALVQRYAQFRDGEATLVDVFSKFIEIRRRIVELEDPDFDNVTTQGMRFFVGCINYATSNRRPDELEVKDESRGVVSVCDVPFKIYKPGPDGRPRPNKMYISGREHEQLALIDLPPDHFLLRVDVDEQGDPVALRWEEWTNGAVAWSTIVFDQATPPTLRVVDSPVRPEPAEPPPFGIEANEEEADSGEPDDDR